MHINSYLVKHLQLSHQQIKSDIAAGIVFIDDEMAKQKQKIGPVNTIKYKQQIIQEGKKLFYYAYHKPAGVESTLNLNIPNNLVAATGIKDYFFPIGRLDKASEGLMILTNDGNLYQHITEHENNIEKKYLVETNQLIDDDFIERMTNGIEIMGKKNKPCRMEKVNAKTFLITLVEGKNRQIRRMCYKLGYEVVMLKRIAIGKLNLEDLLPCSIQHISKSEII